MTAPSEWTNYWGEADGLGAALGNAAARSAIAAVWRALFSGLKIPDGARMLDIASGAVPVLQTPELQTMAPDAVSAMYCADYSLAALNAARARLPAAHFTQCDAARLPFADKSFRLVVSQFGVEYAGVKAFGEAARVLAPGGVFAAIVHLGGGPIDRECAENARLLAAFQETALLPAAKAAVKASCALKATRSAAVADAAAERVLSKAIVRSQRLIEEAPASPAKLLLGDVCRDTARLCERRDAFEYSDAMEWLGGVGRRLSDYLDRMQSMNGAAVDERKLEVVRKTLARAGAAIATAEPMTFFDGAGPAAWRIEARRPSD